MALSFAAGAPVDCDRMATFADGLAVRVAIPEAVLSSTAWLDRMLLVSERAMAEAIGAFDRRRHPRRGSGGGRLWPRCRSSGTSPGPVVLIVTGRNIDEELYRRAVERPESFPG